MTADAFVKLIEEMVDLKVHLVLESHVRTTPELARLISQKRHSDHRRLEQVRAELAQLVSQ